MAEEDGRHRPQGKNYRKKQEAISSLPDALRALYLQPVSDTEINDAAENLLGFVHLLMEIDQEQRNIPSRRH